MLKHITKQRQRHLNGYRLYEYAKKSIIHNEVQIRKNNNDKKM